MQIVKVHAGHIKALQAELAAHKTERLAAAEQQAALRRELESLAAQGRAAATKLASLQEQLEEKTHEVDEAQDLVSLPLKARALLTAVRWFNSGG